MITMGKVGSCWISVRVIYRDRAHINDDRNAQCLNDEAAARIREMIVIVLTN
jgi:hypothetical protein